MKHLIEIDIPDGDECGSCCFAEVDYDVYPAFAFCTNPHLRVPLIVRESLHDDIVLKAYTCKEKYQ